MSKRTKKLDAVMGQGPELIAFYRANPCIAAYDLLGVDLAPVQRVVFEDMWFGNYTISICSRGFGKSQSIDSLTYFKDKGLCYLHEELPEIPFYLNDGEEEIISYNKDIYTSVGFRPIDKLCLEKELIGKELVTYNGFVNRGSSHHPLLTINKDGDLLYKRLDEFKPEDKVCIQRGQNVFGTVNIPLDDAYLIGLFIGDGSIKNGYNISITTNDDYIKNFCIGYCNKNNISYRLRKDKRTKNTYSIYFKSFNYFFEQYKIDRVLSYDKSIPLCIRQATKNVQVAFLQGYFDTDGTVHNTNGGVSCCSVSKKLITELHLLLLNFDIISRLRFKKTKSAFGKSYLIDLFSENALKFKLNVGFRLKRKQDILDIYFKNKKLNPNKDTIPYVKELCKLIKSDYVNLNSKKYNDHDLQKLNINFYWNSKDISYNKLDKFIYDIDKIIALKYKLSDESLILLSKLKEIYNTNYYFDTVVSIDNWQGDCYDFEMNMGDDKIEPNYFSNGFINHNTFILGLLAALSCLLIPGYRVGLVAPSFRQSKMIFAEVEKLYNKSSILREACKKQPIRGSDTAYLEFKSPAGGNASRLEAIPIGNDGAKIRGSRFYLICADELAQIPDKILDMVLRPMGATKQDPMANVRKVEQQNRLIELGIATEDDFEDETVNKMVMTSSGYYKFNHMYRRMRTYWDKIALGPSEAAKYKVHQIPHWLLPEGFLDSDNIDEARRVMSSHEFRMEYEADMISDSEGFFKASVLEDCTAGSGFSVKMRGESGKQYVMGIDPNQGGSASCGVVIIELGVINKVVNAVELKKNTTQELTSSVQELCGVYNIKRIFMDKGGGGKAVMDLLEEGYGGKEPIIDRSEPDNALKEGRHILEMINFNPAWISDANFSTLSLLEDKKLLFPQPPTSTLDAESIRYEAVELLKRQMLNIIVTQTASGALHFDTPKKGQNKDLYSAIILAGYGVKILSKELEIEDEILHSLGGVVRQRNSSTGWSPVEHQGVNHLDVALPGIQHAVPTRRVKIK